MDALEKADYALSLETLTLGILSDRSSRGNDPTKLRVITGDELFNSPIKSREETRLDMIIQEPIEGALLYAVNVLGKAIFETGGVDLMKEIAELATAGEEGDLRMSIIDSNWNGIGSENDGHWWS